MFVKKSKIKAILNDTLRFIIDKTLFWDYRRRIKLEDILYIGKIDLLFNIFIIVYQRQ